MKNKLFKAFLTIAFVSAFAASVQAETLFHKKDGNPISAQEYAIVYKVMLETQFPVSLMYGSYADNEIEAMNQKITAALPSAGIAATFIPTTLYQLFCLKYMEDHVGTHYEKLSDIPHIPFNKKAGGYNIYPKDFKQINVNASLVNLHLTINNFIADTLKKHDLAIPQTFTQCIDTINTIDFWKQKFINQLAKMCTHVDLNPEHMKQAIAIEYHAFNTGAFVLYRGSQIIEGQEIPADKINFNYSISFGNSLLGGILFDQDACAYYYMAGQSGRIRYFGGSASLYGYGVFINKREYALGELSNMFLIPPLISLFDLFAQGDCFHARAKVCNFLEVSSFIIDPTQKKENAPYYQIVARPTAWYMSKSKQAQETYRKMLRYIRDNHIVFKDKQMAKL